MDTIERRIADLILDQLRTWDPTLEDPDLDRPVTELDLDSLDRLEVTHRLERELQVKADIKRVAALPCLREYVSYFRGLGNRP